MNGGGLRYHRNAKQAHTALCSTTVMKWEWSVPHFYWSSLEPQSTRWTSMYHSTNASTYQDDIQFTVCYKHLHITCEKRWMLIQIYMYPDTITGRWMLHNCSCWNGKLCPGLIINAQYNLSAFKMSWLQKYIYIWLRGTSLEIHKCRLLFCSLTCVFTRICSEWNVSVVTEFNLLSLICQSLRKQDWLVPAFPKYDFPIFFSHNAKVSF